MLHGRARYQLQPEAQCAPAVRGLDALRIPGLGSRRCALSLILFTELPEEPGGYTKGQAPEHSQNQEDHPARFRKARYLDHPRHEPHQEKCFGKKYGADGVLKGIDHEARMKYCIVHKHGVEHQKAKQRHTPKEKTIRLEETNRFHMTSETVSLLRTRPLTYNAGKRALLT